MISEKSKDKKIILFSASVVLLFAVSSFADSGSEEISWFFLIIRLLGGLAFFLYGMELMSEGMKKTAGNKMRSILAVLTRNRVIALFCGAFVTMVIQSRSRLLKYSR
ncbi:hypothetical protein KKA14_19805 [bacterium]|nr:hypothetical protein [bacterium]